MSEVESRNEREAARLREKRQDPDYLAAEKARQRVRMGIWRKGKRAKGLCWDCSRKAASGYIHCSKCIKRRRQA
jgi:hypothetical protein